MLTKAELEKLDKDGYVLLGQLLSNDEVIEVNQKIDELLLSEGTNAGSELFDSSRIISWGVLPFLI